MVLTQLSLFFCSHACLILHSLGLPFSDPNRETLLRLAGTPQGVSVGQRAQVQPRLKQLESLMPPLKVMVFGLCTYS